MDTKKPDYLVKIDTLLEKKRLTDEDKAFLRARKSYIDPKVYKELDLGETKKTSRKNMEDGHKSTKTEENKSTTKKTSDKEE